MPDQDEGQESLEGATGQDQSGQQQSEQEDQPIIELDGEKFTAKQIREGMLRQSDYTRKTQEAAETTRNAKVLEQQALQVLESLRQNPSAQAAATKQTSKLETVEDWTNYIDRKAEEIADSKIQNTLQQVDTLNRFKSKHGDYDQKYSSGELDRYIQQNPGHNYVSAFYEIKLVEKAALVEEAKKVAAADGEKKASEAQRAKSSIRILSGSGGDRSGGDQDKPPQGYARNEAAEKILAEIRGAK